MYLLPSQAGLKGGGGKRETESTNLLDKLGKVLKSLYSFRIKKQKITVSGKSFDTIYYFFIFVSNIHFSPFLSCFNVP